MDNLINLLEDLLEYSEQGLSIDEGMARRIEFFLNLEKQTLKESDVCWDCERIPTGNCDGCPKESDGE